MERDGGFRPITGMLRSESPGSVWLWTLHHVASSTAARIRQSHHFICKGAGLGEFLQSLPLRRNDTGGEQGFERRNGRLLRYWECIARASTRTIWRSLFE